MTTHRATIGSHSDDHGHDLKTDVPPSREGCRLVNVGEGETKGGLRGASAERATTFVVGRFCSFSRFVTQLTTSQFDAHDSAPNDAEQGRTKARQPKPQ